MLMIVFCSKQVHIVCVYSVLLDFIFWEKNSHLAFSVKAIILQVLHNNSMEVQKNSNYSFQSEI